MTTVKDILVKAKAEIKFRGVNRDGRYVNERGQCCSVGAVYLAGGWTIGNDGERGVYLVHPAGSVNEKVAFDADLHLRDTLYRREGLRIISSWNDNDATDEQIFELFDAAIESAE